jgi:hypothetical protein
MRLLLGCAFGTMSELLLTFLPLIQRKRSADKSYMREGLGKISQRLAGLAVDFFGVEPEIVLVL